MSSRPWPGKSRSLSELLRPPRGFAPTKPGKVFFCFLAAVIFVAMLTGNNLLFLIIAFLLSFMVVSGIESEMNIRHLDVNRTPSPEIYTGMPGEIFYTIRNPRQDSVRLVLYDEGRIDIPALTRGVREIFRHERTFSRRGRHVLGNMTIFTTYPYGLFRKSITFHMKTPVIVFPAPIACSPGLFDGDSGEGMGSGSESISHVRAYVPGDALTSIVWKKQHLGFVSRVVQGCGDCGSVLVLQPGGDLERKLGQAVFLVLEWWKSGMSFGISFNSHFSGLGASVAHKTAILSALALLDHLGEPEIRDFPKGCHVVHL
ncbi:MAG: hypothetical protein M0R18_04835 [Deltaproteobacteria bacterium]|jgi:hypothetical protein|nr:hypothetical protein [Deltaproteobacteria bacterium]MDX9762589.1 hypothetical protein [Desulfomonilia bacterium]